MVGMRALAAAALLAMLAVAPAARAEDAPGFRVKLLDSKATFDSRERLGKRPIVLRFQASWCKACAREAPGFGRLVERYRVRGVDFIALHVQDAVPNARRFVRAQHIGYPVALDPRLGIANLFGFKGTPATIVIDRKGAIAARIDGESAVTRLPKILDEVLAADSPQR